MSNEITKGKRVLFRLRPEDATLTPGVVASVDGVRVVVLANGTEHETSLLSQASGDLKLGTQDTDPAAWMLHDGKTSRHEPGVQEVGLEHGCYICQDPEFAQMGLPLCRRCPQCKRNQQTCQACGGTGGLPDHTPCTDCLATGKLGLPGHIPADDGRCNVCGYEDGPEDYPQPERVLTPPYTAKTIATRTAPGEAYEVIPSAFVPVPDVEWIDGSGATVTVPEDCTVQGVNIMDSSEPSRPFYWLHVGKALRAGDQIHVPGTVQVYS